MGRPSKPLEHHLDTGNYRPSRHGPLPGAGPPVAPPATAVARPRTLTGRAAEVWDDLAALLGSTLQARDAVVLTELCRWVSRSEAIAALLDATEIGSASFRSLMVSAGIATDKVALLCARCGLTPADEMRVRRKPVAEKPKVATRARSTRPDATPPPQD
jgi:hypothetical protein